MLMIWLLACGDGSSQDTKEPPSDTEEASHTGGASTATAGGTGHTGHTGTGATGTLPATGDTGGITIDTGPVDCTAPAPPVHLPFRASPGDPIPFDPRADGEFWFAQRFLGLGEGVDPDTATLVHPERADAVRTMPNGEVLWLTDGGGPATLYREVGGIPTVWATLPANPFYGWTDLEPHPSGSLIVAAAFGSQWVSASGGHTSQFNTAGPSAYSADATRLWGLDTDTTTGLYGLLSFPVDAQGEPDWSSGLWVAPPPPMPTGLVIPFMYDLEVDGCDRVYLYVDTDALSFNAEQVWMFDPASSTWTLMGDLAMGYGTSYPRFGRAPGEEQTLMVRTTYPDGWTRWHVGVGASVP